MIKDLQDKHIKQCLEDPKILEMMHKVSNGDISISSPTGLDIKWNDVDRENFKKFLSLHYPQ